MKLHTHRLDLILAEGDGQVGKRDVHERGHQRVIRRLVVGHGEVGVLRTVVDGRQLPVVQIAGEPAELDDTNSPLSQDEFCLDLGPLGGSLSLAQLHVDLRSNRQGGSLAVRVDRFRERFEGPSVWIMNLSNRMR